VHGRKYSVVLRSFAILLRGSAPKNKRSSLIEARALFNGTRYNHRCIFKLNLEVKSDSRTMPTARQRRLVALVVMIVVVLKYLQQCRTALPLSEQYHLQKAVPCRPPISYEPRLFLLDGTDCIEYLW